MVEIADCHKELLRTLVKLRREGSIPEEFSVTLLGSPEVRRAGGGLIAINGLSSLSLEALTRAGLIFSISYHLRNVSGTTGVFNSTTEHEYESSRDCYITPAGFRAVDSDFAAADDILMRRPPVELTASLAAFRADFPDPSRLAFVMMRFGETPAHDRIWEAIRHALDPLQFVALGQTAKSITRACFGIS